MTRADDKQVQNLHHIAATVVRDWGWLNAGCSRRAERRPVRKREQLATTRQVGVVATATPAVHAGQPATSREGFKKKIDDVCNTHKYEDLRHRSHPFLVRSNPTF